MNWVQCALNAPKQNGGKPDKRAQASVRSQVSEPDAAGCISRVQIAGAERGCRCAARDSGPVALLEFFATAAVAGIVATWRVGTEHSFYACANAAPDFAQVVNRPHGVGKGIQAGKA